MTKSQLSHIITTHRRKLKKLLSHIATAYDPEQLHDFRVSFKKTRAFIRMISADNDGRKKIKILKKIKPCYSLAGTLRDLQLLQQHITEIAGKDQSLLKYFELLKKEITHTKHALQKQVAVNFFTNAEKTIKHVPEKFSTKDFASYAKLKWEDAYRILIIGNYTDQHLHAVRKNLKDLFYNMKTMEDATEKKYQNTCLKGPVKINSIGY
jgi:CHAD domain-containing protein